MENTAIPSFTLAIKNIQFSSRNEDNRRETSGAEAERRPVDRVSAESKRDSLSSLAAALFQYIAPHTQHSVRSLQPGGRATD